MSPPLIATHPPSSASANMPPNRHNINTYTLMIYGGCVLVNNSHPQTNVTIPRPEGARFLYMLLQCPIHTVGVYIFFLLHALHAPLACLLPLEITFVVVVLSSFPPTTRRKFAGKCVACALDGVLWSVFFLFNTHHWMWGSSVALLLVGELSWQPKNHHPPPPPPTLSS